MEQRSRSAPSLSPHAHPMGSGANDVIVASDLLPPLVSPTAASSTGRAKTIEEAIETYAGSGGRAQLLQALFVSLAWIFDAQQTFINVFTDAAPSWRCADRGGNPACAVATTPCGLDRDAWSWVRPSFSSVVSDWNLQCSSSFVVSLPASAFFAGCLAGGFLLATLADSVLGRKRAMLLACLIMSFTAALTAASPNVWVYAALRFLCGLGRATVGTSALVLSTEMVPQSRRNFVSTFGFFSFTVGFLSLPLMAFVLRDSSWRFLYLWTSLPSFSYAVLLYFLVEESPRWLLVRGFKDEAINTIKRLAIMNGHGATINASFSLLRCADDSSNAAGADIFSTLNVMWERKWAFKRLVALMIVSVGIGMVYYGMPLNVGNLGTDIYLSVTINALAELPSSIVSLFLVSSLNRRTTLVAFTTVSSIASLLCVGSSASAGVWRMTAEVMSFFCSCTALVIVLIYTVELFPTCIRNSALSLVRQALVLGGAIAPVLVVEGRKHSFLSFGVFGVAIGCCGLFVAALPETRGRDISDTMEDEEELMTNASLF